MVELPEYYCRAVECAPDPVANAPIWAAAKPIALVDAVTGGRPGLPTDLRIVRTATHLLLRFMCRDEYAWGTYTERDDPIYDEEVVEAFLSPTGDLRHYYELEFSPHNVVFDARVLCPDLNRATMTVNRGWTCEGLLSEVACDGSVHRTKPVRTQLDGTARLVWTVCVSIPFSAFPEAGAPAPATVWRANFYRIERGRTDEYTAWCPPLEDPANFHVPQSFGRLRF